MHARNRDASFAGAGSPFGDIAPEGKRFVGGCDDAAVCAPAGHHPQRTRQELQ
ncbi:MAG: hypothetical protein LBD10_10010 [Desulfobulbus sp.]|uniref:hypothetical protein n=1 Tax=Desulfobulbus sp. TaxID=895 RepID=UPI00283E64BB|nr:hypothetical protein [Desulfobulbus sp.]MDR2550517.1 hypothetical protein [Desulfobulbus sp.]